MELAEQPEEARGHYLRALEINIRIKPAAEGAFRVLARLERPDAAATLARRLIENGQYSVPVTELHRLLIRWGGGEHGPTVLTELLRYYAAASVDPPEFQRREFRGEEEPEAPQRSANGTPTEAEHWIGLQALAEKFSGLRPPIASLEKAFLSPIDLVFEQNEAATIFPEPLGGDWRDLFLALLKRIGAYYARTGDPLKALPRFTAVWALDHSNIQAALSAAGLLQDNRKKIDPQGKILDRFIESIFEEKTFAYRTNSQDWENILRFHIVLGTIYADQKQWGHDENSDARTAMFQFSHALRAEEKIHERKPDSPPSPGLYERLGECYQAIGIEREALDQYLRAAEIFAKNGSATESKMALEKAAGLSPQVVRIEQIRFDIVKAAVIAIQPPIGIQALSMAKRSIGPGESITGEVRLSAPASRDLTVSLSSDSPDAVTVPSSARIARGKSGASFTAVGASSRNASSKNRVVRITGRLAGVERSTELLILGGTPSGASAAEILQFSATPSNIRPGEQAVLTFRLANAQAARIEPEVGALTSLVSGTVRVGPQRPTRYFLVAAGSNGRTTRKVAFVNVRPSHGPSPRDGQNATPSNSRESRFHSPGGHAPTPNQIPFGPIPERSPRHIKPTPTPVPIN